MSQAVQVTGLRKTYRQGDRRVEASGGGPVGGVGGVFGDHGGERIGEIDVAAFVCGVGPAGLGFDRGGGQKIEVMSEGELTLFRRRRIGVIFQQFNLIPTLTAGEHCAAVAAGRQPDEGASGADQGSVGDS